MSEAQAAGGLDRLPWLADEPRVKAPPVRRRGHDLVGWAIGALLVIAGLSFLVGKSSFTPQEPSVVPPNATMPLPQPRVTPQELPVAPPQPEVKPVATPEVRPVRLPQVHFAPPPVRKVPRKESVEQAPAPTETSTETKAVEAPPAVAPATAHAVPLRPWQPRVVKGAAGRLVQIGAFGSVQQAKLGWRYMVRAYPAMTRLPAVVRPDRNSRGRVFYRFRIGTTSQAHSEVLCQRMQRIRFSCAVVGLPWKAKVER
jgi:hypothetical protein